MPLLALQLLLLPQVNLAEDSFQEFISPLTLVLEDVSFQEAFTRLRVASGRDPRLPRLDDRKVSLRLEGVSYWRALDELCRAHGNLHYVPQEYGDGRIERDEGPALPAFTFGPLRVSVLHVHRVRELLYPERLDRVELTLVGEFERELSLLRYSDYKTWNLNLTLAEDDRHASLLPEVAAGTTYIRSFHHQRIRTFRLRPPADEAGAMRLEGVLEAAVLTDFEDVHFSLSDKGEVKTAGPLTVALTYAGPEPRGMEGEGVSFRINVATGGMPEAERELWTRVPLKDRVGPASFPGRGSFWRSGSYEPDPQNPNAITLRYSLNERPPRVGCRVAMRVVPIRVPFKLGPVPIPQDKR